MVKMIPRDNSSREALYTRFRRAGVIFVLVLIVGVTGYTLLGQGRWEWHEALYMTVITLSTVGYGETLEGMEDVPGARAFTMLIILAGTGALLYLMSALTAFIVEGDLRGALRRRGMQRNIDAMSGHFVVCGVGATGSHIVQELTQTKRTFVVIEENPDKLDRLAQEHDIEPLAVIGDATEEKVLEQAGLLRARGLIAALSDDRDNLFLTFTARAMRQELRIIAKAVEPDNSKKILRAGADGVVSPAYIGGLRMVSALIRPKVVDFLDEMVQDQEDPHRIEEITVCPGSPVIGLQLKETRIRQYGDALVMAVRTSPGHHRYNPPGDFVLREGMVLVVVVRTADRKKLRIALGDG